MEKLLILNLALFAVLAAIGGKLNCISFSCDFVSCELRAKKSPVSSMSVRLRIFGIRENKAIVNLQKAYKLRLKLEEEIKRMEAKKNNDLNLKKEAERRRVFNKYLMSSHTGSSFLKDFHTNRI